MFGLRFRGYMPATIHLKLFTIMIRVYLAKLGTNARFLAVVFLVVVLLILNTWFARLRFEGAVANHGFVVFLFCLPSCIAVLSLLARPRWIGIPVVALCLLISPLLIAYILFFAGGDLIYSLEHGGQDNLMDPCSEVWQGRTRVRAFEVAGEGLWVRQEVRLAPGLLLVRDLYNTDTALGGRVSNVSPGVVRVEPGPSSGPGTPGAFNVKLRGFFSL